jgi:hypothetical protein
VPLVPCHGFLAHPRVGLSATTGHRSSGVFSARSAVTSYPSYQEHSQGLKDPFRFPLLSLTRSAVHAQKISEFEL